MIDGGWMNALPKHTIQVRVPVGSRNLRVGFALVDERSQKAYYMHDMCGHLPFVMPGDSIDLHFVDGSMHFSLVDGGLRPIWPNWRRLTRRLKHAILAVLLKKKITP